MTIRNLGLIILGAILGVFGFLVWLFFGDNSWDDYDHDDPFLSD